MNYFKPSKIISFSKKYGLIVGPFELIRWIYIKHKFKSYNKSIKGLCIDKIDFNHKKCSFFKKIYKGNLDKDVELIINNKRKILFYDENDPNCNRDIKKKWEQNRMQHMPVLAIKYNQTEVNHYINSELELHRLNSIFNNTNAMEVSISTINIITSMQIINESKNSDILDLGKFVFNALQYILENIELGIKYSNNHYFFNLIGILWILESADCNKIMIGLKRFTYKQLETYLRKSVYKDGSFFEGSTHYHKYVTESLLSFLVYINGSNKIIMYYAELLYNFCCYATIDDTLVGFGDNDSGRMLPFPKYFEYASSNLDTINELAQELGFSRISFEDDRKLMQINTSAKPAFGILKVSSENWKVVFRCDQIQNKSVKKVIGGHCHNDQLSIIVNYCGQHLFVDSGTYSYIHENSARINNLKTESHNTLNVEGAEQNSISNDWVYSERRGYCNHVTYNSEEITGEFIGYKGIIHRRTIKINQELQIVDYLILEKPIDKRIFVNFYLHPSVKVKLNSSRSVYLFLVNDLVLEMNTDENSDITIENSYISQEYGKKEKSKVLIIKVNNNFNDDIIINKVSINVVKL